MIKKLNLLIVVIFLVFANQAVKAQRSIGAPALDAGTQACGNTVLNEFTVIAVLGPGDALPTNNEFVLELSDPSGSFDNGITELARVVGPNNGTGSAQDIEFIDFAIPEDANSDDYRLRVTASEVPSIISQISDPIAFHYFNDNLQLILNERDDIIFCDAGSFSKTISVKLLDENNIPVDANVYDWEWFRNDTLISGENSPSITITQEGTYKARVPLGRCQVFFQAFGTGTSNSVDAILVNLGSFTITGSNPTNEYCPQDFKQLTSSETNLDYNYQWFKDGEIIDGETQSFITLPNNNFAGNYTLEIEYNPDCLSVSSPVVVTNISSTFTVPLPESLILLPSQTLVLNAETDAPLGSIFRYETQGSILNQGPLTSQIFVLDAPFVGTYRLEIDPDDACNTTIFTETVVSAAERFDLVIGTQGDTDCDQDTVTIELLEFLGITSTNDRVPLTEDQFAFFAFEWFKDGVSTGETSLSLDISRSEIGGTFELRAVFNPGGLPDTISNNLPIDFIDSNIILDINPPTLEDGIPVTLTAPFSSAYTYEWYRVILGEEVLINGETTNTLVVSEDGLYFVRISSLICTTDSQTAQIGNVIIGGVSELISNVITPYGSPGVNDQWQLPSEFSENDVEITIYSASGKIDFQKSGGYNADWPTNSASQANEPIYYYIIARNNTIVKKGTITVMR